MRQGSGDRSAARDAADPRENNQPDRRLSPLSRTAGEGAERSEAGEGLRGTARRGNDAAHSAARTAFSNNDRSWTKTLVSFESCRLLMMRGRAMALPRITAASPRTLRIADRG
jgi:hypothetical protein